MSDRILPSLLPLFIAVGKTVGTIGGGYRETPLGRYVVLNRMAGWWCWLLGEAVSDLCYVPPMQVLLGVTSLRVQVGKLVGSAYGIDIALRVVAAQ